MKESFISAIGTFVFVFICFLILSPTVKDALKIAFIVAISVGLFVGMTTEENNRNA